MEQMNTPQYTSITNSYIRTRDKSNCNPFNKSNNFGNYFTQCNERSSFWGSERPAPHTCHPPHKGSPCTSLFNNLTRRKSVVDYKREPIKSYPSINIKVNPYNFSDQVSDQAKAFE